MNRDKFKDVQDMANEVLCLLGLIYDEVSEIDEFLRRLICEAREHAMDIYESKI